MDARLESRYLSSNYTTRNLSEDLIQLKTCLKILIFSSYVNSSDPRVRDGPFNLKGGGGRMFFFFFF
jgi:hypothetical protein